MLKINKGEPWLFWPSNLCDTFPESPGNWVLVGDVDFILTISFSLLEVGDEEQTIFTIVPNYTGISVYKKHITLAITTETGPVYRHITYEINKKTTHSFKFVNKPGVGTMLYIDGILMYSGEENILYHDEPHIIIGAGNFPKNGFNLNYCDMEVSEFKLESNGNVIAHHDFQTFIHDKSYDVSGNCNFLNKI